MLLPYSHTIRSHLRWLRFLGVSIDRERGEILIPSSWHLGIALYAALLNCCAHVLIIRTLGPNDFGIFAFIQWLATFAIPLIGIGASAPANQHIANAQGREAPRQVAGIFYLLWCRQCRHILLFIFVCLLLVTPVAWLFHQPSRSLLLLGSLSGLPLLFSNIAGITLRSQRRSDLLIMLQFFGAFLSFLTIIAATHISGEHIGIFLLARAIAETLTLVLAVACVLRLLPVREAVAPTSYVRSSLLRKIKNMPWPYLIDMIVWQRSELFFLALWSRSALVGFYALSAILSGWLMRLIPMLFSFLIVPLSTRLLLLHRICWTSGTPHQQFIRSSWAMATLALPLCGLLMLLAPWLIGYSLGADFLEVVTPLRILLVSAALGSIASVSTTYLVQIPHQTARLRLGFIAALVNIALAVILIPRMGLIGAALSSACAQAFSVLGSMLLCHFSLKKQTLLLPKEV
ncbi:lipopolysaccharide biosynthesis protein [Ktedonospora formicarum]|uniref:Polysaccharide biosynthesis protein C-terminal domain-containing protein n=1 Tax=Ktedonospora formicarum TaxID=2778364 RepID=A0A8J3HV20_9CHLR|nr:polysaccharide biosynthesis C-terminal domain-containing protein [Ktedonospora formicarum]GHO43776.1 hypothetical protein KSX_19390 [Ktedonospora formicarum]